MNYLYIIFISETRLSFGIFFCNPATVGYSQSLCDESRRFGIFINTSCFDVGGGILLLGLSTTTTTMMMALLSNGPKTNGSESSPTRSVVVGVVAMTIIVTFILLVGITIVIYVFLNSVMMGGGS
jgi:hypothetical protein